MRISVTLLLISTLVLSSCGSWQTSNANPRNWFGRSNSIPADTEVGGEPLLLTETNPLLPANGGKGLFSRPEPEDVSQSVETITSLKIERTPTGAIIYATALASRQGAFAAGLRLQEPDEDAPSVMTLSFRVNYPANPTPVGSDRTRTVHAAYSITHQQLAQIRTVRVEGAQNARESRRQ